MSLVQRRLRWWLVGLLTVAGLAVYAQQTVFIAGRNPAGNLQVANIDTNGNLISAANANTPSGAASGTHGACTETSMTIGGTAVPCPASPLAARSTISIQMRTSGQTLTVNPGGTATTGTGGAGIDLQNFDVFKDYLAGTVNMSCICSSSGCDVRVLECP